MKRKTFSIIMLTILATIVVYFVTSKRSGELVGSGFVQQVNHQPSVIISTPAPPQAPKTFNFNSQTDLKAELEKINPQILDSDFE